MNIIMFLLQPLIISIIFGYVIKKVCLDRPKVQKIAVTVYMSILILVYSYFVTDTTTGMMVILMYGILLVSCAYILNNKFNAVTVMIFVILTAMCAYVSIQIKYYALVNPLEVTIMLLGSYLAMNELHVKGTVLSKSVSAAGFLVVAFCILQVDTHDHIHNATKQAYVLESYLEKEDQDQSFWITTYDTYRYFETTLLVSTDKEGMKYFSYSNGEITQKSNKR